MTGDARTQVRHAFAAASGTLHAAAEESNLMRWCICVKTILIIGTHFATPTAGHVKHHPEGGYWLDVGG